MALVWVTICLGAFIVHRIPRYQGKLSLGLGKGLFFYQTKGQTKYLAQSFFQSKGQTKYLANKLLHIKGQPKGMSSVLFQIKG